MSYELHVKPRAERGALITKALEASKDTERLDEFRSESVDLQVVSLDIGVPVYRMGNCRTYSEQQNSIAKNDLESTFFEKGQESTKAQREQHRILIKISKSAKALVANIYEVLEIEGQREPILVTATGVVVNGNRRLSAIRDLYAQDPVKHQRFSHVKCAVLPPNASPRDIDDLEATLQARPQIKLAYDWIGEAQLVRRQRENGRSVDLVAAQLRRKVTEINNVLSALAEAELYLTSWVNKPGQYSLVAEDGEQFFKDIPKQIGKQDMKMQNASRAIAWSLFENSDQFSGRIYNYNVAFGKLTDKVVKSVADKMEIDLSKGEDIALGQFDIAIDEENQVLDYSRFVTTLRNKHTRKDAWDALIDACDEQIELEQGKRRKEAALRSLSQVHSKLLTIEVSTASSDNYTAMLKHIDAISNTLSKLEEKVIEAHEVRISMRGKTGDDK